MCLSARTVASCRSRRYRFIRRYLKFCGLCLGLCFFGKKISAMASLRYKVIFKCIFIHQLVRNFKKMKKVRTSLVRMPVYRMAEPAQPFSLCVFDNFGKVYVSVEYLAVRRMYVDPDRLLLMFDEPILIFQINGFVYPPSNAVLQMTANPTKDTVIRRYLTENPAFTTGYPALRLDAVLTIKQKRSTNILIAASS